MTSQRMDNDATRVRQPGEKPGKIPRRFNASLVILSGYAEGMEYPITNEYTVVGRDKTAGIAVKDQLVSRHHFAVIYHDGEFRVKDLESTNGTMINGAVVEVATIRHKDKIRIGDTVMQFILEETNTGNTYEIAK